MFAIQKNEVMCSYVAQNIDGKKIAMVKIGFFSPCSLRASARRKINILHNFIGFF